MPAMLDDPTAPIIFRTSGDTPYPPPGGPLPVGIAPCHVTLRDRVTTATIIPFSAPNQVPLTLLAYLCDQLGREIEKGDTYPMVDPIPLDKFGPYWFGVFGAIMLLGEIQDGRELHDMARRGCDWERECLGSFYIKPNYPGRSSHVCNGGFLVTDASRNRGVGRLMGETYLDWAPKLLVDAIIYGRDLGQDDDFVSEERFDKIRFYLKNGKYPNGADRAEKSRLRSAATHYKLTPGEGDEPEKLWLKGKEVIADPQRQYEIAREVHHQSHGGINKTTAAIAELYHWVRIKELVSQVIRNCPQCSEMNKGLSAIRQGQNQSRSSSSYLKTTGPSGQSPHTPTPPLQFPPSQSPARPDSPTTQLQLESTQQQDIYPQYSNTVGFDLPVDPALMQGIQRAALNLADLPPSPFLNAGQAPSSAPMMGNLSLSRGNMHDTSHMGMEAQCLNAGAPNMKDELQSSMNYTAGYEQK
ncbi:hypothetical protein J1614_001855 [Plenodomus biglobosus]|nr:hypothetical protein J1614_001855 [Plenodomus biglobosus]